MFNFNPKRYIKHNCPLLQQAMDELYIEHPDLNAREVIHIARVLADKIQVPFDELDDPETTLLTWELVLRSRKEDT